MNCEPITVNGYGMRTVRCGDVFLITFGVLEMVLPVILDQMIDELRCGVNLEFLGH